jgi:hypothetical protein
MKTQGDSGDTVLGKTASIRETLGIGSAETWVAL